MNALNPTPFQALWIARFATLEDFGRAVGDTTDSTLSALGLGRNGISPALAHRISRALTTRRHPVTVEDVLRAVKQTRELAASQKPRRRRRVA